MLALACLWLAGCSESLHDTVHRKDLGYAEALLAENPGLVHERNSLGKTPLHYAVTYGEPKFIDLFIAHGADVNAADNTGMTPLHVAAMKGREDEARLLIAHHANIEARDRYGDTPLQTAAVFGQTPMVNLLVEAGADIHTVNNASQSPEDSARLNHRDDTVAALERLEQTDD